MYALNAATGATVWNYTTGGGIFTAPAIVGNVEYVGSLDNKTYALNAQTGAFLWSYQTGGNIYSSPAVVNGVAYFGSYDGNVYAVGQNAVTTSTSSGIPNCHLLRNCYSHLNYNNSYRSCSAKKTALNSPSHYPFY